MYSALDIAKWFINELHPEPLKLQKLLCLAQGFLLCKIDVLHNKTIPKEAIANYFISYVNQPDDLEWEL